LWSLSDRPWEPDRLLSIDDVRASIQAQFPEVDTTTIRPLGSGWEFDVYLTTDGWVFRFPRREEYSSAFRREGSVLELVAPVLAPWVDVPRVELWGRPGAWFPYPFAGHRLVRGVPVDDPDVPESPLLAARIGSVLGRLHGIPADNAVAAGFVPEDDASEEWLEEALGDSIHLRGISTEVNDALDWLHGVAELPRAYAGPPRAIHNDLCPDHLIVDAGSGDLVGLIDWTDAALADPVLDFVVLVAWRGWPFLREVLQAYPPATDPEFWARLEFQARVRSLHWLASSLEQGTDSAKHIRWVSNAFGGKAIG
jgi:aminoglycoside phosphotransferase (APT) family kinase protein